MSLINHRRGGISPDATVLFAPVRDDEVAHTLAHGLRGEPFPTDKLAVLLLETIQDARDHGRDTYGVDEDEVSIVAVDVSGYGDEAYDDFWDRRNDEHCLVFGRHTYLLGDVPADRLTLIPGVSAAPRPFG